MQQPSNTDWDTVTKIGSKSGRGGAAVARETVIKGKSALNAAQRSGAIVATEKKFASSNATNKGTEGARLTKVDRSDDIVAPQRNNDKVVQAIKSRREEFGWTQAELAKRANKNKNDIASLEAGTGIKQQALLNDVCKVLRMSSSGKPWPDRGAKK